MPVWTRNELQDAALVLGLDIKSDTIDKRYETFGGVASLCLTRNERHVEIAILEMEEAVGAIFSLETLRDFFAMNENKIEVNDLMHLDPSAYKPQSTAHLASSFVIKRLSERLLELCHQIRQDLLEALNNIPQAASLWGWIFEAEAHEVLSQGCEPQFCLLPVGKSAPVSVVIAKSNTIDVFDKGSLSPQMATRGPYHKPKSKTWECIDAFYLPKVDVAGEVNGHDIMLSSRNVDKRLLLFQMTVSTTHAVRAFDILYVLDSLGLLESIKQNPVRVSLAFVVPKKNVDNFERQEIILVPNAVARDICSIRGIGKGIAAILAGVYDIITVQKLEAEIDRFKRGEIQMRENWHHALWTRVVSSWESHLQAIGYAPYNDMVQKIPQYVCSFEE